MTSTYSSDPTPTADTSPDSACTAIVRAVADRTGTDPTDLPPMYHEIDADVLDHLFAPTGTAGGRAGEVTFSYHGFRVTLSYDGTRTVSLEELPGDRD